MSARDAVALTTGRHTDEMDGLDVSVERQVERVVRSITPDLRRDLAELWLHHFGSLDAEVNEEDVLTFVATLGVTLRSRIEPLVGELEDIERRAKVRAERMARRQFRERLAALYD